MTADERRRAAQDFAPTNVSVNGAACTLSVVSDIDAPVPELPGAPAVDEILQPVSIRNSTIYGIDGQPLNIQGINWCAPAPAPTPLAVPVSIAQWKARPAFCPWPCKSRSSRAMRALPPPRSRRRASPPRQVWL